MMDTTMATDRSRRVRIRKLRLVMGALSSVAVPFSGLRCGGETKKRDAMMQTTTETEPAMLVS